MQAKLSLKNPPPAGYFTTNKKGWTKKILMVKSMENSHLQYHINQLGPENTYSRTVLLKLLVHDLTFYLKWNDPAAIPMIMS